MALRWNDQEIINFVKKKEMHRSVTHLILSIINNLGEFAMCHKAPHVKCRWTIKNRISGQNCGIQWSNSEMKSSNYMGKRFNRKKMQQQEFKHPWSSSDKKLERNRKLLGTCNQQLKILILLTDCLDASLEKVCTDQLIILEEADWMIYHDDPGCRQQHKNQPFQE